MSVALVVIAKAPHAGRVDRRLCPPCSLGEAAALGGGPALIIGTETPQVTPALLAACVEVLRTPRVGAVLGPASDGGCWAFGLREPEPAVFPGVSSRGREILGPQRQRLRALGIPFEELPTLREVQTMADAWAVASQARSSRFARALASMLEPAQAVGAVA